MSIVNVEDFTFTYPGNDEPTLKGVSFDIKQGEILGLIGPVGAGKTTLCMAIAGFVPSVTGGDFSGKISVNVNDRNSSESSNSRRNSNNSSEDSKDTNEQQIGKVGMVFEDYAAQLTHLQVLNELITPLRERGVSQEEATDRARELMKKVGLDAQELENKRAWELSGGQQLRLAFAAALALDPPIFILDNLLDKLDPWEQDRVIQIVKDFGDDKTVMIVEQNITLLQGLVERFLVLVDGEVIEEGEADEILRNQDILSRAEILPPIPLRIARDLGLSEAPLTPEEFEQAFDGNKKQDNNSREEEREQRESSPHAIARTLGLLEYDEEGNGKRSQHQRQRKGDRSFGQPVLCIQDVTYCYKGDDDGGTKALEDVNITVREGEVHGVIGRSGAGKSTLIQLIARLLDPSEGKICICDVDTRDKHVPELAMMVGTALENPDTQLSEKTVREEIGFPLKQRQHEKTGMFSKRERYDDDHIEDRVSQVSKLVGVEEKLFDRDPFLLPRGQRQLVAIAEALIVDPKVLLLDQPGMGLSETSRHKISELLEHLCDQGKAVLLTGNDINFIANIADTLTILEQGRVMLQGSVHEVFASENWEQLREELHLQPPSAARLAQRVGIDAVKYDELVSKLSSK